MNPVYRETETVQKIKETKKKQIALIAGSHSPVVFFFICIYLNHTQRVTTLFILFHLSYNGTFQSSVEVLFKFFLHCVLSFH